VRQESFWFAPEVGAGARESTGSYYLDDRWWIALTIKAVPMELLEWS